MKCIIFILLIGTSNCYGQLSGSDKYISDFGLKGQVKTLSQRPYYSKSGEKTLQHLTSDSANIDYNSNSSFSYLEAEFAQNGNVLSKQSTSSSWSKGTEGMVEKLKPKQEIYKYDDQNNWVYYLESDFIFGKDFTRIDSVIYSEDGKLIKHLRYSRNKLIYTRTFEYNSEGKVGLVKYIEQTPSKNLDQYYEYDSLGYSIISSRAKDAKMLDLVTKFDYQDQMISKSYYDKTNYCNVEINNKYDASGNLLDKFTDYSCDSINKLGRVVAEKNEYHSINNRYEYDANGNQILAEDFNNLNHVKKRVVSKFNSNNQLIEKTGYRAVYSRKLDLAFRNVFKYDSFYNVIQAEYYYTKEISKKGMFYVIEKDTSIYPLKTREVYLKKKAKINTQIITYEYEYDSYGNWLTRIGRLKGKIISYVEREITYY